MENNIPPVSEETWSMAQRNNRRKLFIIMFVITIVDMLIFFILWQTFSIQQKKENIQTKTSLKDSTKYTSRSITPQPPTKYKTCFNMVSEESRDDIKTLQERCPVYLLEDDMYSKSTYKAYKDHFTIFQDENVYTTYNKKPEFKWETLSLDENKTVYEKKLILEDQIPVTVAGKLSYGNILISLRCKKPDYSSCVYQYNTLLVNLIDEDNLWLEIGFNNNESIYSKQPFKLEKPTSGVG